MEFLPREIVLDILSRLPITSLLQFRLVCRAWHNLAQDPLLAGMHLSRIGENDPCLILHSEYPIKNQLYSVEVSARNDDSRKVNKIRVPNLPQFDVAGSCKGLLCLCDTSTKNSLYIYNPFTGDCTQLPKSTEFPNQSVVFGFGFHQTRKEYKVLKVALYTSPSSHGLRLPCFGDPTTEAQVFTLGSPGWRSLGKLSYTFNRSPQALVNGRLHWKTWPFRYLPGPLLISFDLADEQFRVVPKPALTGLNMFNFTPVAIKGCLGVAVNCDYGQIESWVMKEYDLEESWIKEYSIGFQVPAGVEQCAPQSFKDSRFYRYSTLDRFLCLLKNGDVLLECQRNALVSYDPKNGTFQDLMFHGMPNLFQSVVHEGSLNWIETVNIDV